MVVDQTYIKSATKITCSGKNCYGEFALLEIAQIIESQKNPLAKAVTEPKAFATLNWRFFLFVTFPGQV